MTAPLASSISSAPSPTCADYLGDKGHLAPNLKVSGKVPPSFIAHSEDDKSFVAGSRLYVEALAAAKVPHEFALYPTGGHGYGLRSAKDAKAWPERCAAWLKTVRVLPQDRKLFEKVRVAPLPAEDPAKP